MAIGEIGARGPRALPLVDHLTITDHVRVSLTQRHREVMTVWDKPTRQPHVPSTVVQVKKCPICFVLFGFRE